MADGVKAAPGIPERGRRQRAPVRSRSESAPAASCSCSSRRLGILLVALLVVMVVAGTIGFALIEGTSRSAYGFEWTIDTVTTLGSIPDPRDTGGRVLKVGLELLGIGTLFYALATVAEFFVSGQLSGLLEERRIQKMIDSLHRPLHRLRLRPRRAAGCPRPARRRRRLVVIDPQPGQPRGRAREPASR